MHNTTFASLNWKTLIAFLVCLALPVELAAVGDGAGDDCDEFWTSKHGPLRLVDNCDYILGPGLVEGHVAQELKPPSPDTPAIPNFHLGFRFTVDTSDLLTRFGHRIGIFELWDSGQISPQRMIFLELEERGLVDSEYRLVIHWRADGGTGQATGPTIDPGLAILEVVWQRSYDEDGDYLIDDNGTLQVYLNGSLVAEVTDLRFEDRLPGAVNYGVFDVDGQDIGGSLTFRPIDYSVRYFRHQNDGSGFP